MPDRVQEFLLAAVLVLRAWLRCADEHRFASVTLRALWDVAVIACTAGCFWQRLSGQQGKQVDLSTVYLAGAASFVSACAHYTGLFAMHRLLHVLAVIAARYVAPSTSARLDSRASHQHELGARH